MAPPRKGQLKWAGDHWKARIRLDDGTRFWHHFPAGTSEAMAKEKAAAYSQTAKERGLVRQRAELAPGSTVGEWFVRWIDVRKNRKNLSTTPDDVWRWNKHVAPLLNAKAMAKVTRADLEAVVTALDDKVLAGEMSWKTARNVWGLVSKAFSDAQRSKHAALRVRDDNPAATLEGPETGDEKVKVYLYPDEATALLSCDEVPHWLRCVYAIATYTAVRIGELEVLRWDDIDLDRDVIHVHAAVDKYGKRSRKSTKTGLARRIPIEPSLKPLLVAMHRAATTERVVVLPSPQRRSTYLRRDLQLAGITRTDLYANDSARKNMTVHDLRATGTTWMALRGDPPMVIMQRAGHVDFQTTQRYIREAESLGTAIGQPFPPLPTDIVRAPDWAHAGKDGNKHSAGMVEAPGIESGSTHESGINGDSDRPIAATSSEANPAECGGEPNQSGTAEEQRSADRVARDRAVAEVVRGGVRKAVAREDLAGDLAALADELGFSLAGGQ